jgi:hypothetical protein
MKNWKERILDFALGALFSAAIGLATIYPRIVAVEERLQRVEKTLETITTVTVKGGTP